MRSVDGSIRRMSLVLLEAQGKRDNNSSSGQAIFKSVCQTDAIVIGKVLDYNGRAFRIASIVNLSAQGETP